MKETKATRVIKLFSHNKKLVVSIVILVLIIGVGSALLISQETNQAKVRFNQQIRGLSTVSTEYLVKNYDLYYSTSPTLKYQTITNDYLNENSILSKFQIIDTTGKIVFDSSTLGSGVVQTGNVEANVLELSQKSEVSYQEKSGLIVGVISPYFEDWGSHKYTVIFSPSFVELNREEVLYNIEVVLITFLLALILSILGTIFILSEQNRVNKAEKKKLDELSRQRREFMVLAAHNLRTPLTSIKGYLSMLTETKLTKEQIGFLLPMDAGVEKLTKIVESILAITSVQLKPNIKIMSEGISLLDTFSGILERYTELAESQKITVNIVVEPRDLELNTNARYLRLILDALVGNAIKFNKKNGTVDVSAKIVRKNIEIKVADTGVGINKGEIDNIYTIFHKSSSSNMLVYDYEGTGVGLYMTKLLTEYLGGDISFESEKGKGTTFTILLPIKR